VESCIFLGGQVFSCENNHGQLASGFGLTQLFQELKSRHIRETEVENDAVKLLLAHCLESIRACEDNGDVDVIMTQQGFDAELLSWFILGANMTARQ
jgi:hypothetical protein